MSPTGRGGEIRRLRLQPTRPLTRGTHREYEAIALGEAIARGENPGRTLGSLTAMQVEDSIQQQGWPEGAIFGPEEVIASDFGVGVRLMRQAFRILEARGACRQQRGRGGGLMVLRPSPRATAVALADHLRWTGATLDHVWEARAFFEALDAETAMQHGGRSERNNPALALVLACLDEFPGGRIQTSWSGGAALGGPEDAARVASAGVHARRAWLDRFSGSPDEITLMPRSPRPLAHDSNNLATVVAGRIGRSISYDACQAQARLGSLWELAGVHDVSLSVIIAAVRILEDAGVVACQRGRNGGVRLKIPDGDTLVGLVHGYLAASGTTEAQCVWICHRLNLRATERVAGSGSDTLMTQLEAAYNQMSAARGFGVMEAWYALQRVLHDGAGNPALHVITRCLGGYSVRTFADPFTPPSPDLLAQMVEAAGLLVEGVRRGDATMALDAQKRTRMALDERRRRQRAPAAMAS